jgi:hypothetical protein
MIPQMRSSSTEVKLNLPTLLSPSVHPFAIHVWINLQSVLEQIKGGIIKVWTTHKKDIVRHHWIDDTCILDVCQYEL